MITDEQLERLPRYAQHELHRLQANLESLEAKLDEISSPVRSRIRAAITGYHGDFNLPEHSSMVVDLGEEVVDLLEEEKEYSFENEMRLKIEQDAAKRWYVEAYASRSVVVRPYSSNIVRLYIE